MTWIHWYTGLGAVMMTVVMGYHLVYQSCKRSTGYHVFEAAACWLFWPLLLVVGIVGGIRIATRDRCDHDSEEK